ncbi:hypothetical protein K427_23275 [Escherichia coli MP1]|nr:hypothetical protein NMECO18_28670 [Escherichia coli]EWY51975.1 hypothetical protein K427_23275 [Escherichia coli MP1]
MPDDLRVIRHFSFLHLHFPQIILPLTVSASGAFLEAIACWWYRLSLFQKIRHILRGFSQCVSFCLALRARGKGLRLSSSWRNMVFRKSPLAICCVLRSNLAPSWVNKQKTLWMLANWSPTNW